jgi:hypothetical protein
MLDLNISNICKTKQREYRKNFWYFPNTIKRLFSFDATHVRMAKLSHSQRLHI